VLAGFSTHGVIRLPLLTCNDCNMQNKQDIFSESYRHELVMNVRNAYIY